MSARPPLVPTRLAAGRADPAARVQRGDGPATVAGLAAGTGHRATGGRKANQGREANL